MAEAKSVEKSPSSCETPETGPFGETRVLIQDIVKRGRAWCVRKCGKYYKMKGTYILEECPGCGSSAIKWSGIRNKRQSDEVSTLRCNRQGRGRCDHADARRRIQARAENRARMEALKQSVKPTEPCKRKLSSSPSDTPPSKAMPGIAKAFAPKMLTLAAAALHMSRMDDQPPTSEPKLTAPRPRTPLEATAKTVPFHPAAAAVTKPVPYFQLECAMPRHYQPLDPMESPHELEPTFPLAVRAGCHPCSMQSKHQLLLMLQRRRHNPQVQHPPIYAPRHLVLPVRITCT